MKNNDVGYYTRQLSPVKKLNFLIDQIDEIKERLGDVSQELFEEELGL